MHTLLSRIEDVFEIRGLIIFPGVPESFMISVTVGDHLKLKQPDGTVVDTTVSAIEITTASPPKILLPLRLGKELTKQDLPIGSELWIDAETCDTLQYHLTDISWPRLTAELFTQEETGHLRFGNAARSFLTATTDHLMTGALEFQSETHSYLLNLMPTDEGTILTVGLLRGKHDASVNIEIEASLNQAGIAFTRDG